MRAGEHGGGRHTGIGVCYTGLDSSKGSARRRALTHTSSDAEGAQSVGVRSRAIARALNPAGNGRAGGPPADTQPKRFQDCIQDCPPLPVGVTPAWAYR